MAKDDLNTINEDINTVSEPTDAIDETLNDDTQTNDTNTSEDVVTDTLDSEETGENSETGDTVDGTTEDTDAPSGGETGDTVDEENSDSFTNGQAVNTNGFVHIYENNLTHKIKTTAVGQIYIYDVDRITDGRVPVCDKLNNPIGWANVADLK